MPRSSHPALAVVNIIMIPLGLACVMVGIGGLSSTREIWWAFALLTAAGALVVYGGIRGVIGWTRSVDVEEHTAHEMIAAAQAGPSLLPPGAGPVLAHWRYAPDEWRAYTSAEIRFRTRDALASAAFVAVLGTVVLGLLSRGDWPVAIGISGGMGALIGLGRWVMAWTAHRRNVGVQSGEVIVGPTALLWNGRYEVLRDRRIDFGGARVLTKFHPPILEITIKVPGRYRRIPEEYRIPIPAGRLDEAQTVADALNRAHGFTPQIAQPAGG
ncbi:MAG TPA: hypothetical protein VFS20_01710 [Longimicrobium sp.]|nr:hypothetical protein [Longimicrobium sp.]